MKRRLFLAFTALCGMLFAPAMHAQKVAFVDMQYILGNLPQYETANEQLTMVSKRWQREVDALFEEARVMQQNYQTEQIFLSEDMRQQREAAIVAKEGEAMEAKRRYFGKDGELFKKREALLKPIQDEVYAAIQAIAQEKHYDIVKDRTADPSLIYMSSRMDISDQVLQKLGAK